MFKQRSEENVETLQEDSMPPSSSSRAAYAEPPDHPELLRRRGQEQSKAGERDERLRRERLAAEDEREMAERNAKRVKQIGACVVGALFLIALWLPVFVRNAGGAGGNGGGGGGRQWGAGLQQVNSVLANHIQHNSIYASLRQLCLFIFVTSQSFIFVQTKGTRSTR